MGLKNLGDINEDGVHAADLDSLAAPGAAAAGLGDRWPVGVSISGVDVALGVAGMEISSVSSLSSIIGALFVCCFGVLK